MSHWCVYFTNHSRIIGLIIEDIGSCYMILCAEDYGPRAWGKSCVKKFDSLSELVEYWVSRDHSEAFILAYCNRYFPNKMGRIEGCSLEEEFFSRVGGS